MGLLGASRLPCSLSEPARLQIPFDPEFPVHLRLLPLPSPFAFLHVCRYVGKSESHEQPVQHLARVVETKKAEDLVFVCRQVHIPDSPAIATDSKSANSLSPQR